MANDVQEKEMNRLIAQLCAARELDAAATKEAHRLAIAMSRPHSVDDMRALWAAGDRMQEAHQQKMDAWERVRNAVAPVDPGGRR